MADLPYSDLADAAAKAFTDLVGKMHIEKNIGKIPGLATDKITLTGDEFGGAQHGGGSTPSKTPGIDF